MDIQKASVPACRHPNIMYTPTSCLLLPAQMRLRLKAVNDTSSLLGQAIKMHNKILTRAEESKQQVEQHARDIQYLIRSLESYCAKELQHEAKHTIQVLRDMEELMVQCAVDPGEPMVYPHFQVRK